MPSLKPNLMADDILSLSGGFPDATESDWLAGVEKALKGGGLDRITRKMPGGLTIRPLYQETDFPSSTDPSGAPGAAPFIRGADAARDRYLPWDIRQRFTHPAPKQTNAEILRDLERGVSSVELALDCSGTYGCAIETAGDFAVALEGIRADIAPIALDHQGKGTGASRASALANWADTQANPGQLRFAFNIDPFGPLTRYGPGDANLDETIAKTKETAGILAKKFALATTLRADARPAHEAGASEAQELACLIAAGVDLLRRLEAAGWPRSDAAKQILFTISVSANYGIEIAKLRAARRLWARCLEALDIDPHPMKLQAVSSARMLTRYDAWTNMLRNTSACFAASVGGADVITVQAFNEALGRPEELGRRTARNTQIIAMEESGLGRIADPTGGAWFIETVGADLAEAAWAEFQTIEREGGYGASLMSGKLQARIAEVHAARMKDVERRKIPVTGVSEFPLLDEVEPPIADVAPAPARYHDGALNPVRLAHPFEELRDAASGKGLSIFLATLGPIAEHTARADFARNLFAAGGIAAKEAPVPPQSPAECAAAFKASGCKIAVICGADPRYADEAEDTAKALKDADAQYVWLAGKGEFAGIDSNIFMGVDVVHQLKLAHEELGV